MNLIDKLNILMKRKNIKNLSQLSKEADIPYTTLKSIFDGDVNDIRLSTSRKLCDYFKITLDELLDDDIPIEDFRYAANGGINMDGLTEEQIGKINEYVDFIKNQKK